jgi:hypothetical protein
LDEDRDNLLERIRAEEVQRLGREIGQTTYRTLMWISIPVALFIGGIGAVSVFKAACIDRREFKCACVGKSLLSCRSRMHSYAIQRTVNRGGSRRRSAQ